MSLRFNGILGSLVKTTSFTAANKSSLHFYTFTISFLTSNLLLIVMSSVIKGELLIVNRCIILESRRHCGYIVCNFTILRVTLSPQSLNFQFLNFLICQTFYNFQIFESSKPYISKFLNVEICKSWNIRLLSNFEVFSNFRISDFPRS